MVDETRRRHANRHTILYVPSAAIIFNLELQHRVQLRVSNRQTRCTTHLDLRVAFHDLLDACKGQRRVPVVGGFLFCCIDLALPERTKEILEWFARLDERFLVGRGHRGTGDGSITLRDPITSFTWIYHEVYQKTGRLFFTYFIYSCVIFNTSFLKAVLWDVTFLIRK